jgi:soluble lytic murein transglycosylase
LLASGNSEDTLRELDAIKAKPSRAQRARMLHTRGMALFRMRTRYPEAARVLALAAAIKSETQASDAYHAARALARADRDAQAVKAYRAFAKRYPDSRYADDAMHDAAWLELRHDMPRGEANMRAVLVQAEKANDREHTASALWHLAFRAFSDAHYAQAVPLFVRYAATSEASMVRARGLYWAGRAAQLAQDKTTALSHFETARAVEPLHYYALMAGARLRELGQTLGDPFAMPSPAVRAALGGMSSPAVTVTTPVAVPVVASTSTSSSLDASLEAEEPELAAGLAMPTAATTTPGNPSTSGTAPKPLVLPDDAAFYLQLGLVEDAVQSVQRNESTLRAQASARDPGRDDLLPLLATYFTLEQYARPYRLAARERPKTLREAPAGQARSLWEALFPRPYSAPVKAAAAREQLPEDFVYSIMRKESAYDPRVVSHADAIGLLQLLERTGRAMARDCGMANYTRDTLFDPEANVQLGARYLSNLRARYAGNYAPAIAAYNAGEHRVDAWLARAQKNLAPSATLELDRFVEEIPIEQTHNYVRRVLANWARYRYLAGLPEGGDLPVPLTL